MFKVMMSDLEQYKQKADMSKQLATYFSPFSPITTFSHKYNLLMSERVYITNNINFLGKTIAIERGDSSDLMDLAVKEFGS